MAGAPPPVVDPWPARFPTADPGRSRPSSRPTRPRPSDVGAGRVARCRHGSPTRPPRRTSPRGASEHAPSSPPAPRSAQARTTSARRRTPLPPACCQGTSSGTAWPSATPTRARSGGPTTPRCAGASGAHHHPVRAGARDLLPVPRRRRQLHVRHRVQLL